MIGDQIIDCFEERSQCATVVLFLEQELSLREDLDEVHEAVTGFFAQTLGVGSDVCDDSNDRFVNGLKEARSVLDHFVDR